MSLKDEQERFREQQAINGGQSAEVAGQNAAADSFDAYERSPKYKKLIGLLSAIATFDIKASEPKSAHLVAWCSMQAEASALLKEIGEA